MLKNYLTLSFRNMKRHKVFSIINLIGLVIGITLFILIMIWIGYEMSYDSFNENIDQIYRLCVDFEAGNHMIYPMTMPNAGPQLVEDFPEVMQAARLESPRRATIKIGEKTFTEEGICHGDNSIFEVFTFPIIKGDRMSALVEPYTAVLTRSIAEKYFGESNPIGVTVEINNTPYRITGIIEDIPQNSHFRFNIMGSFETLFSQNSDAMRNWFHIQFYTYLLLKENTSVEKFGAKLTSFVDIHIGELLRSAGTQLTFFLQPLKDIHLHSELSGDIARQSNMKTLQIFFLIAIFILIIACINFINLSTANAGVRAREIGLRKAIGSKKSQLILQFLTESIVLSFMAMVLTLVIIDLTRPSLQNIFGVHVDLSYLNPITTISFIIIFPILVGVLAGSYPAFYLSRFQPVKIFRSGFLKTSGKAHLRNILVIMQFTISLILIISTITIFNQIKYMQNKDPGFEQDNAIIIPNMRLLLQHASREVLKEQLSQIPEIKEIGFSSLVPGFGTQKAIMYPEGFPLDQPQMGQKLFVDDGFLDALGVQFTHGRNFSQEFPSDPSESVIINETAAKTFGWKEPLGKTFTSNNSNEGIAKLKVVGVVKDFHSSSMHTSIEPLIIYNQPAYENYLILRTYNEPSEQIINNIKRQLKIFNPNFMIKYYLLDEILQHQYASDQQIGKMALYFCLLAILLAILGLFGLTTFLIHKKTKEIGIRKVLGATVSEVSFQLSGDYIRLIFISILLAVPLAYFGMSKWLQGFAYQTGQPFWIFFISSFFLLLLSIITVSFQTVKAARTNPVDIMKYE